MPTRMQLSKDAIRHAAAVLQSGGLVVFPTDTVYGLMADPSNTEAIRRIYDVKGREGNKPLQLLLRSTEDIGAVAQSTPPAAHRVARIFPGLVTMVLDKGDGVSSDVVAGGHTVGVRIPDDEWCAALLGEFGGPLAATSANRSGEPSPRTAAEAEAQLGDVVDLIVDGGLCRAGVASTVIDFTGPVLRILREGALSLIALEEVLGVPYVVDETA